jgi:hypothetical protein
MSLRLIEIGQVGQLPEAIKLDDHRRMVVEMTVQHFEILTYQCPLG